MDVVPVLPVISPWGSKDELEADMRAHPGKWWRWLQAAEAVRPHIMGPWEPDDVPGSKAWRPGRRRRALDGSTVASAGCLGTEPTYCVVTAGEAIVGDTPGSEAECDAKLKELGWLLA